MSFITRPTKIYNEDEPQKRHSNEASYMHYGPYGAVNEPEYREAYEPVQTRRVVHIIGHRSHLTKAQTRWLQHEDQRAQAQKGIAVEIPEKVERKR